jgi:hypothetical protein
VCQLFKIECVVADLFADLISNDITIYSGDPWDHAQRASE